MTSLKNKNFKPMLEVLEDRFMPSANPWTMLPQPILNGKVAEAAVGRILHDAQQQLNSFQMITAQTPVNQAVNEGVFVLLLSRTLAHGQVQLGGFEIRDSKFLDSKGDLKPGYDLKSQFRVYDPHGKPGDWQSADFKFVHGAPPVTRGYGIYADRSIFDGKWNPYGQMRIEVQIQIVQNGTVVCSGISNIAKYWRA